ncbi:MAG: hypothetical protein QOH95_2151 [Gaiellaceae bacterium]|jgi:hypothetical protein|nr:hypothetical protein [Gaiellaceae bacterium]
MSFLRTSRKLLERSAGRPPGRTGTLALLLAVGTLAVAGCGGSKSSRNSQTTATTGNGTTTTAGPGKARITLLEAAQDDGPWTRRLSLRLGRAGVPVQFFVCAVVGGEGPAGTCRAEPGSTLPARSTLDLEQHPAGPGLQRPDSPGWGLVGTSEDPLLRIVLSDFVSTNNKPGTITYRVTLRNASGHLNATSNTIAVTWHR